MGLNMSKNTRYGITGTYWKIIDVVWRPAGASSESPTSRKLKNDEPIIQATVGCFPDRQASKRKDVIPLESTTKVFNFPAKEMVTALYEQIKRLEEFGDATDVIE